MQGSCHNTRVRIRPSRFKNRFRFEDNTSSPELESNLNSGEGRPTLSLPVIPLRLSDISSILHAPHHSSTPYRTLPKDHTFDVEPNAPLLNESRHAATIAAEVSAAAAVQASKEFWRMRELKITKLRGGYSANAKLMFRSWKSYILANISNRELNNKAAIQLIKEQTLDNACHARLSFSLISAVVTSPIRICCNI